MTNSNPTKHQENDTGKYTDLYVQSVIAELRRGSLFDARLYLARADSELQRRIRQTDGALVQEIDDYTLRMAREDNPFAIEEVD